MNASPLNVELLHAALAELPASVPSPDLSRLAAFLRRLLAANAQMNLTRITDPDELTLKHVVDSLAAACFVDFPPGTMAADMGSGAGFPGCVLAAAHSETAWTLIESTGKKADFLRQQTDLFPQMRVLAARLEDLGHAPEHRGAYDRLTCRALAAPAVALEYGLPLLKPGGILVALYGDWDPALTSEVQQIACGLGAAAAEVVAYRLPCVHHVRSVLIVRQGTVCPDCYPRRPGKPTKQPLTAACFT